MTSVVELAKVLTPENRGDVLPRFFHLSKSGAKAVSAAIRPNEAAPHRAVVTAVRPTAAATALAAPVLAALAARDPILESPFHPDEAPRANPFPEPTPPVPAPLSHSHPGASADEILEAGLDLLLERHAKRKGLVEKPWREPPPAKPDHVPAHVKRAVWKRDSGRSKGNASMSLRELRTFGVVRQVEAPGDRRDFYVTEPDVWTMFFRILRERKRREFDPALEAIHRLVEAPGASGAVRGRLEQMADLLATMDGVASRFLENPDSSRSALAFVAGLPLGGAKKRKR